MLTYPDIIRSGYTQGGAVGPVAVAAEIKDETQSKMQSTINAEVQTALSGKQATLTAGQNIVINGTTISAVIDAGFHVEVVQALPTTGEMNTIYFVPASGGTAPNVYDEYMYINNSWEVIGTTQVDLSNYYNKTETDTLLAGKQGTLTAGSNISINNNTISATDTTYSASDNIDITNNAIKAIGYRFDTSNGAFAEGDRDIDDGGTTRTQSTATGVMAHAEGFNCTASGKASHVEGSNTQALGVNSHSSGRSTIANGYASYAEGDGSETGGNYGSATTNTKTQDSRTAVAGDYAHAEGFTTIAYGYGSHAEGNLTFAKGNFSHAEGMQTNAISAVSHAEGQLSTSNGTRSHAEGYDTETGGNYGSATSNPKTAGASTDAGAYAHAEGNATIANGVAAHSEGRLTLAKGTNSHAEGGMTIANGSNSHAEGYYTKCDGSSSHAEGRYTQTLQNAEHAEGSYNLSHTDNTADDFGTNGSRTIHSIGIGTADNARQNAVEVMQNGDAYLYGVGGYDGVHIPSETGYSYIQSLQTVISDLHFRVIMLEPCPSTMLKYRATSNMSEQIAQYIPNYTDGDYRSPEGYAVFSNDLVEISANTFSDVTDLLKIEIPEGVTDIGDQAFKNCSLLQEVILPKSLSTIGDEAFLDCSGIYAIRYNGTMDDWGNITMGADVFAGITVTQIICIDGPLSI